MSPQAGQMLVDQIVPRIRATVPKSVQSFGGEDAEELIQDAIAVAAQMLHQVEASGKNATAGNIAYYALLHLKAGRRSQSGTRTDVMAPATQLDRRCALSSLEAEVGYDPELDEPITLDGLLSTDKDDPATVAARDLDWGGFISSRDYRYGVLLRGMAEGRTVRECAADCGEDRWSVYHLQRRMNAELRAYFGPDALADAGRLPPWKQTNRPN
jgi:hypothetical protein